MPQNHKSTKKYTPKFSVVSCFSVLVAKLRKSYKYEIEDSQIPLKNKMYE